MLAIYKKELKSFFHSMIGWLFLALNLFFAGWNFRYYGMMAGYPYVSYIISASLMIFLLSVPILTMRIFSEEAKNKTDQLLYTAPVPVWKIILGKYLALLSVFTIIILGMCLYPLVLTIYGKVPMGENYVALLGFWLFGAACLAIGVLLSVVTDSPVIAAVLTFFTLLLGAMISGICGLIDANGNVLTDILQIFNLTAYLDYEMYGMLYLPSFLYYGSVIFICLYFTGFIINKRRWRVATHGVGKAIGSISGAVILVLVIIAINVGVNMLPKESITIDLTYNSINSLTAETKAYLEKMDSEPIQLYFLADQTMIDETVESTLVGMDEASDLVTMTYISPSDNPYFYMQYTDTKPNDNSVIVVCGDKVRVVDYYDCYLLEYQTALNYATGEYEVTDYSVSAYDGEGRIIAAIDYVTREVESKIYCIVGHDELELEGALTSMLANANYTLENINLLTYPDIPEDAACVFLIAPLFDYSDEEIEKINRYLEAGGNAIVVTGFSDTGELTNYYSLLEPYGLRVCPGLVMEEGSSYYNEKQYFLLPDILSTDITEGVYTTFRTKYVYMPYAKGLQELDTMSDVTIVPFLKTTEYAYSSASYNMEVDDVAPEMGPFILGAYVNKVYPNGNNSEIVAFSSEYLLWDDINRVVNGNNYTVFINAVNKIMGEEQISIIPPKSYSYDPITMNSTSRSVFSILFIGVIPAVLLLAGFNIWFVRRKY